MTTKTALRISGSPSTRTCYTELVYQRLVIVEVRKLRSAVSTTSGAILNDFPLGSFSFNE